MIETDRLVAPDGKQNEDALDRAIRPRALVDYVGQPAVREQMEIFVAAARGRREALDHTLIFGPPGLGKTTLAHIIANEMGSSLKSTSGPVLEKAGDLAALLTNLEPGDVLFIDEIHRLSPHVEEVLYPAMEDFQLDIMIGEGPAARSIKLELPQFTLVGATRAPALLTRRLARPFRLVQRLEFYSVRGTCWIVGARGASSGIGIDDKGAREIARAARGGTPRIANRLLRRCAISPRCATTAHQRRDRRRGAQHAERGPAGLRPHGPPPAARDDREVSTADRSAWTALAAAISEERGTIEDVLEPYLIQQGLHDAYPRGRMVTRAAYCTSDCSRGGALATPDLLAGAGSRRERRRAHRPGTPPAGAGLHRGYRCRRHRLLRQLPEVFRARRRTEFMRRLGSPGRRCWAGSSCSWCIRWASNTCGLLGWTTSSRPPPCGRGPAARGWYSRSACCAVPRRSAARRVTVACVNSATHRPCMIPRRLREALAAAGALPQLPDTRQQSMEIPA